MAHDHAYYGYACLNLGLTDREYYRCGGCGHEAERGYDEEEPYYTDSRITGIFSPTESDY
ncbi:MAG: hypothetical protein GX328_02075 [Clostridiaceae bacterium]|nr:hypothetical protein [Clostridiaceae bacterium]